MTEQWTFLATKAALLLMIAGVVSWFARRSLIAVAQGLHVACLGFVTWFALTQPMQGSAARLPLLLVIGLGAVASLAALLMAVSGYRDRGTEHIDEMQEPT